MDDLMILPRKGVEVALLSRPITSEAVFVQPGGADAVLSAIEKEVRAFKADISTKDGRSAVASIAHKVARSKTALDDMGKELVADWKSQSAIVDRERKRLRDRLDELKDEVRRPLTEWENAETARIAALELAVTEMSDLARFEQDPSSAEVEARIERLRALYPRDWYEFITRAADTYEASLSRLYLKLTERQKIADEAAELARLRAEKVAREQKDRDERIAAEAAEKARKTAEEKADRDRKAAELAAAADRDRAERAQREAEEKTARAEAAAAAAEKAARDQAEAMKRAAAEQEARRKREADEAAERERLAEARREQDLLDAIERERIAEERRKAEAEEAAKRAERASIAAAEAAAAAERKRIADEQAVAQAAQRKREADVQHRAKINREAAAAVMKAMGECSSDAGLEQFGKAIIVAIAQGRIPHVTINY